MNNVKIYSDYVPAMSATTHSFPPSLCDRYRIILQVLISDIEMRPKPFATVKNYDFHPDYWEKTLIRKQFFKICIQKRAQRLEKWSVDFTIPSSLLDAVVDGKSKNNLRWLNNCVMTEIYNICLFL